MRTNRYTPNFRLGCFKLGFEHHLLTRRNSSKPTWKDWLTFIWNIDQPLIDDRYAHEEFDYLIVGDDPLLSLIAGLYLAQAGHRVLLHPSLAPCPTVWTLNRAIVRSTCSQADSVRRFCFFVDPPTQKDSVTRSSVRL